MNQYHGGPQCESNGFGGKDGMTQAPSIPSATSSVISEAAIRDLWPIFVEETLARLINGVREYGDSSFGRTPLELSQEIGQEQSDVLGWNFILWVRQRRIGLILQAAEDFVAAARSDESSELLMSPRCETIFRVLAEAIDGEAARRALVGG